MSESKTRNLIPKKNADDFEIFWHSTKNYVMYNHCHESPGALELSVEQLKELLKDAWFESRESVS